MLWSKTEGGLKMPRYLALFYLTPYKLFGVKKEPGPNSVVLTETELDKAWEQAVNIVNESGGVGVDKIEIYQLVSEQTFEENQIIVTHPQPA